MADITCSFCARKATAAQAFYKFIAGPRNLFVCRECVEIFVDRFAVCDPQWYADLIARRKPTP